VGCLDLVGGASKPGAARNEEETRGGMTCPQRDQLTTRSQTCNNHNINKVCQLSKIQVLIIENMFGPTILMLRPGFI
jgi:hypothetical protein